MASLEVHGPLLILDATLDALSPGQAIACQNEHPQSLKEYTRSWKNFGVVGEWIGETAHLSGLFLIVAAFTLVSQLSIMLYYLWASRNLVADEAANDRRVAVESVQGLEAAIRSGSELQAMMARFATMTGYVDCVSVAEFVGAPALAHVLNEAAALVMSIDQRAKQAAAVKQAQEGGLSEQEIEEVAAAWAPGIKILEDGYRSWAKSKAVLHDTVSKVLCEAAPNLLLMTALFCSTFEYTSNIAKIKMAISFLLSLSTLLLKVKKLAPWQIITNCGSYSCSLLLPSDRSGYTLGQKFTVVVWPLMEAIFALLVGVAILGISVVGTVKMIGAITCPETHLFDAVGWHCVGSSAGAPFKMPYTKKWCILVRCTDFSQSNPLLVRSPNGLSEGNEHEPQVIAPMRNTIFYTIFSRLIPA